jgi:hypothetical protein
MRRPVRLYRLIFPEVNYNPRAEQARTMFLTIWNETCRQLHASSPWSDYTALPCFVYEKQSLKFEIKFTMSATNRFRRILSRQWPPPVWPKEPINRHDITKPSVVRAIGIHVLRLLAADRTIQSSPLTSTSRSLMKMSFITMRIPLTVDGSMEEIQWSSILFLRF